jgi:hypothetical protein
MRFDLARNCKRLHEYHRGPTLAHAFEVSPGQTDERGFAGVVVLKGHGFSRAALRPQNISGLQPLRDGFETPGTSLSSSSQAISKPLSILFMRLPLGFLAIPESLSSAL